MVYPSSFISEPYALGINISFKTFATLSKGYAKTKNLFLALFKMRLIN